MSRRSTRLLVTVAATAATALVTIPAAAAQATHHQLKPPQSVTIAVQPSDNPFVCSAAVSITKATKNATYAGTVTVTYLGTYTFPVTVTTDRSGNGTSAPWTSPGTATATIDGMTSAPATC